MIDKIVLPAGAETVPFVVANAISNLGANGVGQFNSQLLAPPFRLPYLIREIRFLSPSGTSGNVANKYNSVKLAVGHKDLTRDYVQIAMLCPEVQLATEESVGLAGYGQSLFRWVLPKPMYCRPGEGLRASIQNLSIGTISPEIVVVGDVLPAGTSVPKTVAVPYATVYTTGTSAPAAASSQEALRNPWPNKTLHMQRFIGRGYSIHQSTSYGDAPVLGTLAPIVTLVDSEYRTSILPTNGVQFGEAFDARTCCLEHRRPLPPKGWFQTSLYNIRVLSQFSYTYLISAIGWREESI